MPAIRNTILMVLAHKTSTELLDRDGKEKLAAEIMREAVRPLGIEIATPEPVTKRRRDAEAERGDARRRRQDATPRAAPPREPRCTSRSSTCTSRASSSSASTR